jgi:hypothetical protein
MFEREEGEIDEEYENFKKQGGRWLAGFFQPFQNHELRLI